MKWLFFVVVAFACFMLATTFFLLEFGDLSESFLSAGGALGGFVIAYLMQTNYSVLDEG